VSAVHPASVLPPASLSTRSRVDIDRAYRAALRHSRHVRWLRLSVTIGVAVALLVVVVANYLPYLGEIRLPGELGKLVIAGTKITMQQPKINGFTSDGRPYVMTANSAAQEISAPDILELNQVTTKIQMADKSQVDITAPRGRYDLKDEMLTLYDDVEVLSSAGYAVHLAEAVVDTRKGNVVSEKPVAVKLTNGFLNAKRLDVSDNGDLLRFGGGVSMTLNPDHASNEAKQP